MNGNGPLWEAMRRGGARHKRRIVLGSEGAMDGSAIETEESARMTETGFEELTETKLHRCKGCYRTIRRLEELGGVCVICENFLCTECAGLRCSSKKCRKCVCPEDHIELGQQVYCWKHGVGKIVIRLAVFAAVVVTAFIIIYSG